MRRIRNESANFLWDVGLDSPSPGCIPNQPLLVLFQWWPNLQTGGGSQWALARVPVEREEPCATHSDGCRDEHEVVTARTERWRIATGQAFGLLKDPRPIDWYEAQAQALVQVSEEPAGSVPVSQEHVKNFDTSQVRKADDLGAVRQESLNGLTLSVGSWFNRFSKKGPAPVLETLRQRTEARMRSH